MRKVTTQFTLLILAFLYLNNTTISAQNAPIFNLGGGAVCVDGDFTLDITVSNFNLVAGFQFTLGWNPEVIQFQEVININEGIADILFGNTNEESDRLVASWFEPGGGAIDLDPETVLFSVNYTAVGANSAVSMISFLPLPAPPAEVYVETNGVADIATDAEFNGNVVTIAQPMLMNSAVENDINMSGVGSVDITIMNGTAPYTYAWSNGMTTEDLTDVMMGDYSCTVTDAKGCETDLGSFTVDNTTNTHEIDGLVNVGLSPNPTTGKVNLKAQLENPEDLQVLVYNFMGALIYAQETEGANIDLELDLSGFATGNYIVQLRSAEGMHIEKLQLYR